MIITVLKEEEAASVEKRAIRLERIGKILKNYFIQLMFLFEYELFMGLYSKVLVVGRL